MTACRKRRWLVQWHGRREATAACTDGRITVDGGGVLVREVEEGFGIVRSFVGCVTDHRDPERIEECVQDVLVPEKEARQVLGRQHGSAVRQTPSCRTPHPREIAFLAMGALTCRSRQSGIQRSVRMPCSTATGIEPLETYRLVRPHRRPDRLL